MREQGNDWDFLSGMIVGALIVALLAMFAMPSFVSASHVNNAGKMFCAGYGLDYSYYTIKDDAISFVCTNDTVTKIDTIGQLRTTGTAG